MGKDPGQVRQETEQTRAEMGDTVDALGYKTDVKTRAKENLAGKRDRLKGAAPDSDQVKQGARRAAGAAQQNPIGLALGSLAVGFVAGLLIPTTRVEDEKLGPVADDVKERAKEAGQEAAERGKHVAQQAAESAKQTAQETGQRQADEMRSTVEDQAQQANEQAGSRSPS